ncbi:MAG: hypothetical protein PVI43_00710 [Candidatus Bathyarchaeota archaeon]|jgi:hypothetical protein
MDYDLNNFEDAVEKAKSKGKIVIEPLENELQIDIDSKEQYILFATRMKELNENFHCIFHSKELPSQGGDWRKHIYLKLAVDTPILERTALQLFLGSDPVKEYLSLCLVQIGDPHPILMFENLDFTGWGKNLSK